MIRKSIFSYFTMCCFCHQIIQIDMIDNPEKGQMMIKKCMYEGATHPILR